MLPWFLSLVFAWTRCFGNYFADAGAAHSIYGYLWLDVGDVRARNDDTCFI